MGESRSEFTSFLLFIPFDNVPDQSTIQISSHLHNLLPVPPHAPSIRLIISHSVLGQTFVFHLHCAPFFVWAAADDIVDFDSHGRAGVQEWDQTGHGFLAEIGGVVVGSS